ncbi:unnamed protein product [Rotaria socialis]|uniref:Uncharacterized protein n=1 Tax=Rotaria socialis TaxID=392032 RepID=A0A817TC76_9BILA|nr:unnamed protein product [Rotaria socialis]CAF3313479.1 unnamed protein product [Rotaria socialis]CAF3341142.1 unnamed protein product [Rotaria socialis]CAF3603097.1 unnamed protein product [Rotaria socialis]CAF3666366.1 unnamed protein product [Rotaria socialis]
MTSTTNDQLINDIEMDHFGCSTHRLSTTGINSCVSFIILLNHGEHIFMEHRSDVYFPTLLNMENVRLCFENIAEHICRIQPQSDVTGIVMLGGIDNQLRSSELQKCINEVIEIGVDSNDTNKSRHFKQLFNNIICNDVCFNIAPKGKRGIESITGEPCFDLIVDKYIGDGDGLIVVVQHIKKFVTSDIIIGVLAIGIKSNNRWFIIDKYEAKNNQDKTERELNYLLDATNHFCLRAKALGAVEVQGDMARYLLNYGKTVSKKQQLILKVK